MTESIGETIRKVQNIGGTSLISLPPEWIKKNGIDKGTKLLLRYNGVVVITPTIEDARVEIKKDSIWFYEGKKKIGITKANVKRSVNNNGTRKTVEIIKTGMEEKGFHPAIFFDKIEQAVNSLMFEFREVE